MSHFKKKLLIKIVAACLAFVLVCAAVGVISGPVIYKLNFFEDFYHRVVNSAYALSNLVKISLPREGYEENLKRMGEELKGVRGFRAMGAFGRSHIAGEVFIGADDYEPSYIQHQSFSGSSVFYSYELDSDKMPLGVKRYSSTSISPDSLRFDSYTLDQALIDNGIISLVEGEFFGDEDYTGEIPVIVTEGFALKLGDKLKITLDTRDLNYGGYNPLTISAYVIGICKNDRYLPDLMPGENLFFPIYQFKPELVFLPDLSHLDEDVQFYEECPPVYATFDQIENYEHREEIAAVVEKYGVLSDSLGFPHDGGDKAAANFGDYEAPYYRTLLYAIYGMAAVTAVFFVAALVSLLKRWHEDD